ncbi:hypothetical protein KEM52_001312, partial [Ascosphaera acerosa]
MSPPIPAGSGAPDAAVPNPNVCLSLEGSLAAAETEVTLQQTLNGQPVPHRTLHLTPKGRAIMAAGTGRTPVRKARLCDHAAPELSPVAERGLLGLFESTLDSINTAACVLRGLLFRAVDVTGKAAVNFTSAWTKVHWLRRAARELGYCLVPLGPEELTFREAKGKAPAPLLSPHALPLAAACSLCH